MYLDSAIIVKLLVRESDSDWFNRHLAGHHLTLSQFSVLEALYHLGPLGQRLLAKKVLRSSGNLTLVIDNLERDGLVRRERGTRDRRMVTVHLTEHGQALIAKIMGARRHDESLIGEFFYDPKAPKASVGRGRG